MKKLFGILLIFLLFTACGETDYKKQLLEAEKRITQAYRSGKTEEVKEAAQQAIDLYHKLAEKVESPEEKANYLFKAAGYYINPLGEIDRAIYELDKLIEKYPKTNIGERAFFLKAYIFANELKKTKEAKKLYREFIEKYPDSDMVEQAKLELLNLGLEPEEILKNARKNIQ